MNSENLVSIDNVEKTEQQKMIDDMNEALMGGRDLGIELTKFFADKKIVHVCMAMLRVKDSVHALNPGLWEQCEVLWNQVKLPPKS